MLPDEQQGKQGDAAVSDPSTLLPSGLSMKWVTLESLRILQTRLQARSISSRGLFLLPFGLIEGNLQAIDVTYESAIASDKLAEMNLTSAVSELRSDLLGLYQKQDPDLKLTDVGALLHIQDVVLKVGARRLHFGQFTLFASDIQGFTLLSTPYL